MKSKNPYGRGDKGPIFQGFLIKKRRTMATTLFTDYLEHGVPFGT